MTLSFVFVDNTNFVTVLKNILIQYLLKTLQHDKHELILSPDTFS